MLVGGKCVGEAVRVGVKELVPVGVRVDVEVCVAVTDGVNVNTTVGEKVVVGVNVAVAVGSGLSVNAVPSPPVYGVRRSSSESSGFDDLQMRFGTPKAQIAVAKSIAQTK